MQAGMGCRDSHSPPDWHFSFRGIFGVDEEITNPVAPRVEIPTCQKKHAVFFATCCYSHFAHSFHIVLTVLWNILTSDPVIKDSSGTTNEIRVFPGKCIKVEKLCPPANNYWRNHSKLNCLAHSIRWIKMFVKLKLGLNWFGIMRKMAGRKGRSQICKRTHVNSSSP